MDFKTGRHKVILRLVEAYGFSTRQMLCDHLGVSKSTLVTRFMRDIFPAEWVIQFALKTGVSLSWLVSGAVVMYENTKSDVVSIPKMKIIDGEIHQLVQLYLDKTLLKSIEGDLLAISYKGSTYIVDKKINTISYGI
jgi:hypothetical protein